MAWGETCMREHNTDRANPMKPQPMKSTNGWSWCLWNKIWMCTPHERSVRTHTWYLVPCQNYTWCCNVAIWHVKPTRAINDRLMFVDLVFQICDVPMCMWSPCCAWPGVFYWSGQPLGLQNFEYFQALEATSGNGGFPKSLHGSASDIWLFWDTWWALGYNFGFEKKSRLPTLLGTYLAPITINNLRIDGQLSAPMKYGHGYPIHKQPSSILV